MDPASLIAFGAIYGGGLVVAGFLEWRRRRLARAVPPLATIATAKPGVFVRLVGTIVDGEQVNAPITGRPCVCFSALINGVSRRPKAWYEQGSAQHPGGGWTEVASRVGGVPFVLDDGSGKIAIDPRGMTIRLAVDHNETVRDPAMLALHDPTMLPQRIYVDELVLDEGIVEIGAPVVVEGCVQRDADDPDGAVFRAADTGTVLVASKTRSMSISDLPGELKDAGWRGTAISVK
jgi:hypothetical protein